MMLSSDVKADNIVDEDTGEILGTVYHCPDVIGHIPKPYQLIIDGNRVGSFASWSEIRTAIRERKK